LRAETKQTTFLHGWILTLRAETWETKLFGGTKNYGWPRSNMITHGWSRSNSVIHGQVMGMFINKMKYPPNMGFSPFFWLNLASWFFSFCQNG
jgi:hypothetical protein